MITHPRRVLATAAIGVFLASGGLASEPLRLDANLDPFVADPLTLSMMPTSVPDDGASSLPPLSGPFPDTENMRFLSQIPPALLGAQHVPGVWSRGTVSEVWGWTSSSGEEYALVTHTGGTSFVRVTDPTNPVFLGVVQTPTPFDFRNIWWDVATFGNYAYIVSELSNGGMRIVDMSGLDALGPAAAPDTPLPAPITSFTGGGYDGAQTIFINEASGFAYLAGVHLLDGAANNACGIENPARFNTLILDLNSNPAAPSVAACLSNVGEHAFYVVNYTGPDTEHQGREIAFVFDGRDREGQSTGTPVGGKTLIWDVTDKSNIVELASFRLPGLVFSNHGWATPEQDFLFISDELDELVRAGWKFSFVFTVPVTDPTTKPLTGTYVVDIRDLDNPLLVERYEHTTVGLDDEVMVVADKLYVSSYTSGARVLQIDRGSNGIVELSPHAHTDTEPRLGGATLNIQQEERFGTAFMGLSGIYVLPGGTILGADRNNGLIVMSLSSTPCSGPRCNRGPAAGALGPDTGRGLEALPAADRLDAVTPNPTRGTTRLDFTVSRTGPVRLSVLDVQGREIARVASGTYQPGRYSVAWDAGGRSDRVPVGLYFVRLNTDTVDEVRRLVITP